MKTQLILIPLILTVIIPAAPLSAEIQYSLTDLGEGSAYSINNSGQVVGTSDGSPVIFDTTNGGNNIYLGDEGVAYSINNSGQVVGYSGDQATLFDPTGQGNNIYMGQGVAYSINDNGQIVGYAYTDSGKRQAVIFDTNDTGEGTTFLGSPFLGGSVAYSINNDLQIVGSAYIPLHSYCAMLFDAESKENNTFLAPLRVNGQLVFSFAGSINNSGQIVGSAGHQELIFTTNSSIPADSSDSLQSPAKTLTTIMQSNFQVTIPIDPNFPPVVDFNSFIPIDPNSIIFPPALVAHPRATLFDPTGDCNNINLGTLPGGGDSTARSINNKGQIVGHAYTNQDENHAALFDSTGGSNNIDLNTLIDPNSGWTLTEAHCIGDDGWIVGQMTNNVGDEHAYLLTPVPEQIEAEIEINPNTINLKSKGKWITCHIWLPEEYNVADVNSYSIFLEDELEAEWVWFNEQQQIVMARFSRSAAQGLLVPGEVELTATGELTDGTQFTATDTIAQGQTLMDPIKKR
jgi:probable HAF family extracellular repeat protein